MRAAGAAVALGGSLIAGACGGAAGGEGFTLADSAGVAIATSRSPAWAEGEGWTVADPPDLKIGVVDGDTLYELYQIAAARQLSDGRIAVPLRSSNQLRYYSAVGEFLASVGGTGGGPGEFRRIGATRRIAGDSLSVFDGSLGRVSVIDPRGVVARTVQLEPPGLEPLSVIIPLNDGRFVVTTGMSSSQMSSMESGIRRFASPVFIFDPDGAVEDTVPLVPDFDITITTGGGGFGLALTPFGRVPAADVFNDLIYLGRGDSLEIRVFRPDGQLVRIIRAQTPDLTLTDADAALYRDRSLAAADDPDARSQIEARLAATELPAAKAAFTGITVDPSGNVWLRPPRVLDVPVGDWTVFDPDGRWLGSVRIPAGLDVHDIGDDYILGKWTDDLEVEYLRRYRLVK